MRAQGHACLPSTSYRLPSFSIFALAQVRPKFRKISQGQLTTAAPGWLRIAASAFRSPAFTRSWVSARSNSATATMIWNMSRPEGVLRSRLSRRRTNATPRASSSASALMRCLSDRFEIGEDQVHFPGNEQQHGKLDERQEESFVIVQVGGRRSKPIPSPRGRRWRCRGLHAAGVSHPRRKHPLNNGGDGRRIHREFDCLRRNAGGELAHPEDTSPPWRSHGAPLRRIRSHGVFRSSRASLAAIGSSRARTACPSTNPKPTNPKRNCGRGFSYPHWSTGTSR